MKITRPGGDHLGGGHQLVGQAGRVGPGSVRGADSATDCNRQDKWGPGDLTCCLPLRSRSERNNWKKFREEEVKLQTMAFTILTGVI